MKYITAKFDYATPIRRQITVPLDSNCGVAVKTYLNGEETASTITVDGSPTVDISGWACHDFTTGSQPGNTEFEVEASFDFTTPTSPLVVNWRDELSAVPTEYSKDIYWYDLGIDDSAVILAKGTQLVAYIDGQQIGLDSRQFYVYDGVQSYQLVDGKWIGLAGEESDYIKADSMDAAFHIEGSISAVHEVRIAGRLQLGQLNTSSQKFYLGVTAEDKGYFEVE